MDSNNLRTMTQAPAKGFSEHCERNAVGLRAQSGVRSYHPSHVDCIQHSPGLRDNIVVLHYGVLPVVSWASGGRDLGYAVRVQARFA